MAELRALDEGRRRIHIGDNAIFQEDM